MKKITISDALIKESFYKSTEKFQVITVWLGIFLNLFWFISDYYVIYNHYIFFLKLRTIVSLTSALIVVTRKWTGINIYGCVFFLVLGISVKNAYMWSVMDLSQIQIHAFAYIVLFIGVGMLAMWETKFSIALAIITIIANVIFYKLYSQLSVEEFLLHGGLITFTVIVFSIFLIRSRYNLTYNEIKIRIELEQSNKEVEKKHDEVLIQKIEIQNQNQILEEKKLEITDSIKYAKRIQFALIPSEDKFNSFFKDSFVLFKPKDVVSGDFYWIYQHKNFIYYVTADCTGHGVPGGFMTMLGLSFIQEIIVGQDVTQPDIILNKLRDKLISALNQSGSISVINDGMDISVCKFDSLNYQLLFSSANNNLYVIRNTEKKEENKIEEYTANRQPCGQYIINTPFSMHTIQLNKGDCIYTFTDGYADQFGGPNGKKFRYKEFKNIILKNYHLSFIEQKKILNNAIDQWRGDYDQLDDILLIGVMV